jgi:hypothetical protein
MNLKLNEPLKIIEMVSDETEALQDVLKKQTNNTIMDAECDEEVEDDHVKGSITTRVKKSFPVIGVHPSFHNLIDTICFRNDGSISDTKYFYYFQFILMLFLDHRRLVLKYQFVLGFWKQ